MTPPTLAGFVTGASEGDQGGASGAGLASAVVQMVLALVLIGLALALVKKGYDNISTVRDAGGSTAAKPSDD